MIVSDRLYREWYKEKLRIMIYGIIPLKIDTTRAFQTDFPIALFYLLTNYK